MLIEIYLFFVEDLPPSRGATSVLNEQEDQGSIPDLLWDFSPVENFFHSMYELDIYEFQFPLSVFCPVLFSGGCPCVLPTSGQRRPSNCIHVPICVDTNLLNNKTTCKSLVRVEIKLKTAREKVRDK